MKQEGPNSTVDMWLYEVGTAQMYLNILASVHSVFF